MKTIRLNDLEDWTKVGKGVELVDTKRRKVRLMLNSDGIASVYFRQGKKRKFLALAEGLTCIEFDTIGKGTITCEGAETWWRCSEIQHRQVSEANDSFAQPHEPRRRNPELEIMMMKMQQNSDKRMAEMERWHEQRIREVERNAQAKLDQLEGVGKPPESGIEHNTTPADQGSDSAGDVQKSADNKADA